MNIHHQTLRKIIRVLRNGSSAAETVAGFFFDAEDGPAQDLRRESEEAERLADSLEQRFKPQTINQIKSAE